MKDVINLQKSHTQDPALLAARRRFLQIWDTRTNHCPCHDSTSHAQKPGSFAGAIGALCFHYRQVTGRFEAWVSQGHSSGPLITHHPRLLGHGLPWRGTSATHSSAAADSHGCGLPGGLHLFLNSPWQGRNIMAQVQK